MCAPADTWRRFLADGVPGDERTTLADHLDTCPDCRHVLDQLTDRPLLANGLPKSAANDPDIAPLLQRLCGLLHEPTPRTLPSTIGAYEIQNELGRGGMGVVYRARDPLLNRPVAIKVLRRIDDDADARRRLVREAQVAARLNHDHVVPVFAVHDPPGEAPFLVMRLIEGVSLRDRIRTTGSLTLTEAARIVSEVADALAAAHAAGIVHRDIKPGNILLDTSGRSLLTDFGLARPLDRPGTTRDASPGTPEYMSPEQVRTPDRVDARSDVYSLGVTLYECLTAAPPFRGLPHQVLSRVVDDEPVPPRRLDARIPRDLETICLKAMAKEPLGRYQSATDFRADLQRWQRREPIIARPTGALGRMFRLARRKPLVSVLAATAVAALVLSFALLLQSNRRAARDFRRMCEALSSWMGNGERLLRTRQGLSNDNLPNLRHRLEEQEALLRENPKDPALCFLVASCHYQIGIHLSETSNGAAAREALTVARDLFTAAESHDSPINVNYVASANIYLSDGNRECGRYDEALANATAAREIWQRLTNPKALTLARLRNLALCEEFMGDVALARGQFAEAAACYHKAREQIDELCQAQPTTQNYTHRRGAVDYRTGRLALRTGDATGALPLLTSARTIIAASVRYQPDDVFYVRDVARVDLLLAEAHMALGANDLAKVALDRAHPALDGLLQDCPNVHDFHAALGDLHRLRAKLDGSTEALARARKAYQRALEINPERVAARKGLLACDAIGERGP